MRRRDFYGIVALGVLTIFPPLAVQAMHLGEKPMSAPGTILIQERSEERERRERCERIEREDRETRERLERARGDEREGLERRLRELGEERERCRGG
jgi:hypothetical protein